MTTQRSTSHDARANTPIITDDLIAHVHQEAEKAIQETVFGQAEVPSEAAKLEPVSLVALIAWQILIPYFVGVAGGLTIEMVKNKLAGAKTEAKIKPIVYEAVGKPAVAMPPERRQEIIDVATKELEALGTTQQQARAVADRVLAAIETARSSA